MGKGNCSVFGSCEGQWYIDYSLIDVYRRKTEGSDGEYEYRLGKDVELSERDDFVYDEEGSMIERENFEDCFCDEMSSKFPCFEPMKKDYWLTWKTHEADGRVLLESKLFYIIVGDNEWSLAVKLIQKKDCYGEYLFEGLQKKHSPEYLAAMKEILLNMFGEVSYRTGAWTSGVIRKEAQA